MSDELVFYHHPASRARIARWMLEETGQPYRTELLAYGGSMKAPAYLQINPLGKVPAISHRGIVVTETAAICAYLADAFPEAGLAPPPTSPARGPYYRWLFYGAGPVEAMNMIKALKVDVPPERERMVGYGTIAAALDTLEQAVAGKAYIVGDAFSAADVYVGSQLGFGMLFGMIEKRPAFEAYCASLATRPAAVRARQMDDALMAKLD